MENEIYQKPVKLANTEQVIYWAEQEGILLGTQKSKAKKFLELGCVLSTKDPDLWIVKHIEGYNRTNHKVNFREQSCSCQFFQKVGGKCSHVMAVELFKFQEKWNK